MSQPTYKGHESWRESARKKKEPASKNKWILTIIGSALVCFLALLIILFFVTRENYTHVLVISVGATDRLEVPPIRFSKEDTDRFDDTYLRVRNFDILESNKASQLDAIERISKQDAWHKKDRLVVYISAHGISESNQPYLLCRDNTKLEVSRVLQAIKRLDLSIKLVVFDTGHILSDPYMGMMVNDFLRLLEKEVVKIDDPNLWVLTSSSMFETPQLRQDGTGTIFGQSFVDVLLAEPEKRKLYLKKLHMLVFQECEKFGQHPLLMRGGEGVVTEPDRIVLAHVPRAKKSEDESAPEEELEETQEPAETKEVALLQNGQEKEDANSSNDKGEETKAADETEATDQKKKDAKDETQPKPEPPPPIDPTLLGNDELLDLIFAQKKDAFEAWPPSSTSESWTPIDFAPQIWRRYVEFLVALDVRNRSGSDFDSVKIKSDLRNYLEESRPRNNRIDEQDRGSRRIASDYRIAAESFANHSQGEFYPSPRDLGKVGEAIRYLNRSIFRIPYFIRWHYWSSVVASNDASSTRVRQVILATQRLKIALQALSAKTLPELSDDRSRDPQVRAVFSALDQLKFEILKLNETIFRKQLFDQVNSSKKLDPLEWKEVELLLALPLSNARQRQDLLKLRQRGISTLTPNADYPSAITVNDKQWASIREHASFYRHYLTLIDETDPVLKKLENLENTTSGDNVDLRWKVFADFGSEFKTWTANMKNRLKAAMQLAEKDFSGTEQLSLFLRQLQVVDARDAVLAKVFPCLPFPSPKSLRITVNGRENNVLRITRNNWKNVNIRVRTNEPTRIYTLQATYPNNLEVRLADDETPLSSGAAKKFRVDSIVQVQVRSKGFNRTDSRSIRMNLAATAGDSSDTAAVRIDLNEIGVIVGPDHVVQLRSDDSGTSWTQLRPFPGRETAFDFELQNESTVAKEEVKVELHAFPTINGIKKGLLYENGQLVTDVQSIVKDLNENRPTRTQIIATATVPRIEAKSSAPCKFKLEEENSDASKSTNQSASPVNGLAMVITDKEAVRQVWLLEFDPLHPRDYLTPKVYYDIDEEKILAFFDPKDNNSDGQFELPENLEDQPIEIDWDNSLGYPMAPIDRSAYIPESGSGRLHGEISRKQKQARLHRDFVLPRRRITIQRFHVDGYPRAFAVKIDREDFEPATKRCIGEPLPANKNRMFARINLLMAQTENFGRLYHTWKVKPKLSDDLSKLEQIPFYPDTPRAAVFPAVDSITAEVQIDAPRDVFRRFDIDTGRTETFRRLRQIRATSRIDGQNRLAIDTKVTDHRIEIPTAGIFGPLQIKANLYIEDSKVVSTASTDIVDAILSSKKSEGQIKVEQSTIQYGDGFRVRVSFNSEVGIKSAQVALLETAETPVPESAEDISLTDYQTFLIPKLSPPKPGKTPFWIKGTFEDRVGNKADLEPVKVLVDYVPPVKDGNGNVVNRSDPKLVGDLKIRVKSKSQALLLELTTKVKGKEVTQSARNRVVVFRNVPAGKYEVNVTKGFISARKAKGSTTITLAQKKDFDEIHEIVVEKQE